MTRRIEAAPLTAEAFAPFGEVMDASGNPDKIINQGLCARFHDLATLDFVEGRAGVSLFQAELRALPYRLDMMERHPLGSQAFIPMSQDGFLVIVAEDDSGRPAAPHAFLSAPGQAINFHRGTWHGVLTPLSGPGLFAVIDRIGAGDNLEEVWFEPPWEVSRAK
ncbi:ureidoglycolate lyase [Rhodobacteraceae bacterium 63075]|nr:ureidoglycolate lyase [Rhodobacteraceae bacterium 63075]